MNILKRIPELVTQAGREHSTLWTEHNEENRLFNFPLEFTGALYKVHMQERSANLGTHFFFSLDAIL